VSPGGVVEEGPTSWTWAANRRGRLRGRVPGRGCAGLPVIEELAREADVPMHRHLQGGVARAALEAGRIW
jgi:hypothetical protein